MKILLIHSDGVEVIKNKEATSNPQVFPEKTIEMDGLILVAYVSVEDQDTYDTDLIAKQGAKVIEEAILQITDFPEKIRIRNEEIRDHNQKIANGKRKGKERKLLGLIKEREMYRVDKVLVYPWAHLSKFLSNEKNAMDVCPKISKILNDKGIEASYSPFGWYKSFKINCIGHEVAEMYRDVKLYIQPEEHIVNAVFKVITTDGNELNIEFDENKNVIPPNGLRDESFYQFLKSELGSAREDEGIEPAHLKVMKEFELVDFDENSDKGNLRWYSNGVIMKNLIKNFIEDRIIDYGAILIDTPIMYTVKNKKLTAQTARFPARAYWVESGSDRYLLRYASDFLLFDMFSSMNLKPQYLPMRVYEYEQYDFRREQEGELTGLRRLRGFIMPDMHTLCKDLKSSIEEFKSQYFLIKNLLEDLGIKSYIIFRTTQEFFRDNKDWIKDLIQKEGQPALLELWEERYYYFVLKFERPVLSAQNKSATLSTNQIDVESSLESMIDNKGIKRQKYNINFIDEDGETKYPVILHNSPTGGLERILWGLIETAIRDKDKIVPGFRTWLSPIQVRILTISNDQHDYAEKILEILSKESYRVDYDDRNEKLGKKIRQSEIDWIPYTIILGKKEQEDQTISVRKRLIGHPIGPKKETSKNVNNIKLSELIEMLNEDTKGFPKHKLPKPFRKFSTKVYFRK
ncbi:MAG TPA: threonine--tRNA ligase [Candidatus Nanopelagicaceae bacterium]|nr:threonine--tRNA ligase [Candidatus Nanopelagicaceae bacterium]